MKSFDDSLELNAFAFILSTIGELNDQLSKDLLNTMNDEFYMEVSSIEEAIDGFLELGMTENVVEWIKSSWNRSKQKDPQAFAVSILKDLMTCIDGNLD